MAEKLKCPECGETQGLWPDSRRNSRSKKWSHYTCYACGHKFREPRVDWKKEYYGGQMASG